MVEAKVLVSDLKHIEGVKTIRQIPKVTDKTFPQFVTDYCDTIENVGLSNWGFSVVQKDDGLYVIDGNKRITAIKYNLSQNRPRTVAEFGSTPITVHVLDLDEYEVLLMQTIANTKVEKATPKQIMSVIVQLLNADWSLERIAKQLSLSIASVEKYLKLNVLPETIVDDIENGDITIQNALTLTTLPRTVLDPNNAEELAAWVEKAKTTKADEFAAEVGKEIKADRAARKGEGKKTQYAPEAKLRSKEDLAKMLAGAEQAAVSDPENIEARVRFEVMQEIFSLDEKTVESNRLAFEKACKEAEEKSSNKKKEKTAKDAHNNVDEMVKMGALTAEEGIAMKAKIDAVVPAVEMLQA